MFRPRRRPEIPSTSTAKRGAVGSARVWDEDTRAATVRARERAAAADGWAAASPAHEELARLVRTIVHSTLQARLPECPPYRRAELARELERRMLALLAPTPNLTLDPPADDPRSPATVPAEATSTPQPADNPELASTQSVAPPVAPSEEPRARLLGLKLEDRLAGLGSPLTSRSDLRERLVALALEGLAEDRVPGASAEDLSSLDILTRRSSKLEQALAEARAALAHVSRLEYVDPGLSSLYRTIQGLAPEDPRHAQKGAALECIFRANLALQKPG
jgi:hypothetical protein